MRFNLIKLLNFLVEVIEKRNNKYHDYYFLFQFNNKKSGFKQIIKNKN